MLGRLGRAYYGGDAGNIAVPSAKFVRRMTDMWIAGSTLPVKMDKTLIASQNASPTKPAK